MKKKDLMAAREQDEEKLANQIQDKMVEVQKARLEIKTGRGKNVRAARGLRRDRAQLKTLLQEKRILRQKGEAKETKI